MMSFANQIDKLSDTTYCFNVEYIPVPPGGTKVKMYCPMLMPCMSYGNSGSSGSINTGKIFINDSSCKPSVPSSVSLQNYIQFTTEYNSSFEHVRDVINHVPVMTKFRCKITNGLPIIRTYSTDMS